jgi:SAM-dependent methyltransferase
MAPLYPRRHIVRCPKCRLTFWDGRSDPAGIYTAAYFAGAEYRDYLADKADIQRNFRDRVAALRRFQPAGRLLEIGCAYGFFLDLARRHWDVRGVEIVPECVQHARDALGLNVQRADFAALPDEPEAYDVICLWDTLEHLPEPVACVEKAARWLRPGGVLAITTNDIDSLVARVRRGRWRQIHSPTHLYYFSASTLTRAVRRAGLQRVHLSYVGYRRSYKSMAYGVLVLGRKRPRLYRLLTLGGRLDFPVYLNLFDIMMLLARKPGHACPPGRSPRTG